MSNNILTAIKSIVENNQLALQQSQDGVDNRANQTGDALEDFVKNAFADCLGANTSDVIKARNRTFSYLGNSTNPPDAMLRGGDAIEIKKINEISTLQLQLNSSYPKNKLYSNNSKISHKCKECESWNVKDMLYVVGQVHKTELQNIFFIYGDLYCDSPQVYEHIENVVKDGIQSIENIEFTETKELGRINKVDHLEISDLRVRGMWLIKTPFHQFGYLTSDIQDYTFKLVALIPINKYSEFENIKDFESFCNNNDVSITDESLPDPQNPANLIDAKLIVYYY